MAIFQRLLFHCISSIVFSLLTHRVSVFCFPILFCLHLLHSSFFHNLSCFFLSFSFCFNIPSPSLFSLPQTHFLLDTAAATLCCATESTNKKKSHQTNKQTNTKQGKQD